MAKNDETRLLLYLYRFLHVFDQKALFSSGFLRLHLSADKNGKNERKNLSELALVMLKIGEREQRSYVGGLSVTADNPYAREESYRMSSNSTWDGDYVERWGYTFAVVTVYGQM